MGYNKERYVTLKMIAYYILLCVWYLVSLLPFWVLYRLSDCFYCLLYYVVGYRKKVVRENLASSFPEKSAEELRKMARRAAEWIPPKVAHWSAITGLVPTGITITAARTRFGSCSGKNRLSFSCRLVNYPEAAIDLVVVHELCHIKEKNHGPAFYALLSRYLPDHKERKKLLRFPNAEESAGTSEEGEDLL